MLAWIAYQEYRNDQYFKLEYWQELAGFLDRRDKIIVDKFRNNKDHNTPKQ